MEYTMALIFLVYFLIFSNCSYSQSEDEPNCSMLDTCGACIRQLGCVWCNFAAMTKPSDSSGCFRKNEINDDINLCNVMINPKMNVTVLQNDPLSTGKNAVQIRPQKVRISLRRGQEYKMEFTYAQAADYPVDLYYIMDLSYSMEPHKKQLSALGTKLANTMKNLTKNFKLGFGSFVDKPIWPYVESTLQNPCLESTCDYVFKNHMSLSDRADLFSQEVANARLYHGGDTPEDGFDALMQAMVCQYQIGWRKKARHLLVFSTDAGYHLAGDGKTAGIVIPHDGKCYLENNMYTHGLVFDFPTIAQLNAKAIENDINIIFAVTQNTIQDYIQLYKRIKDSSIGIISVDSSNIIKLITGIYNKIVDSVKISDNSDSNIEIKYYSNCASENIKKETNQCDNLHVGVQVNFTAVIKVLECPKNGQNTKTIYIKPGGLNEGLTVEIEALCKCDCENQGDENYKANATECSYQGDLKCGVCDCYTNKLGSNCECDRNHITSIEDTNNCRPDMSSELCSGFGICKCNKCICQKRSNIKEVIYGKYCQCDNYSCTRSNNKLCSGENRGTCVCGKCRCLSGYTGDACECPDNNSTCISPENNKICSGRGECKCGKCNCNKVNRNLYLGDYCDPCLSCTGSRCAKLRHCVECVMYKTGFDNQDECLKKCAKYKINQIENVDEHHLKSNEKFCIYLDEAGCSFKYKYSYDVVDNKISIFVQKDKICTETNVLGIVLIIIGSILLCGIITLILWKSMTHIHDRKEYAKFEEERSKAGWNREENPLFKNPTSSFANPTFSECIE